MSQKVTIERGCWNCCNLFKKTVTDYKGKVETSFKCKKFNKEEENLIAFNEAQLTENHRDMDGSLYRIGCNCENYEAEKEKVSFT